MEATDVVADATVSLYNGGETLAAHLAGASMWLVFLALGLHTLKLVARGRAWQNILQAGLPSERIAYRSTLAAYLAGIGANAVLPARPGEALRLLLVRRTISCASYSRLAASVVAESLFDAIVGAAAIGLLVFTGAGATGSLLGSPLHPLLASGPWAVAGVAAGGTLLLFLGWRLFASRLRRVAGEVKQGLMIVREPRRYLCAVVSWQCVALVLRLGSIFSFLSAFHVRAGLFPAVLVVGVQSACGLIPLLPGGAGAQQALLVGVVGSGATAASVLAFGVGAQVATAFLDVVLGVLSLTLLTGSLRVRRPLAAAPDVV